MFKDFYFSAKWPFGVLPFRPSVRMAKCHSANSPSTFRLSRPSDREALTRHADRRAMVPSVTEMRVAKCALRCAQRGLN